MHGNKQTETTSRGIDATLINDLPGDETPAEPKFRNRTERALGVTTQVMKVSPETFAQWQHPTGCQRPITINKKVLALVPRIIERGAIPGVITIGVLNGVLYLLDGQHRREAFFRAIEAGGPAEVLAEVRYKTFENEADMNAEYADMNSALVKQRPDDILRAREGKSPALQLNRQRCKFVGYDRIRQSAASPILGMSAMLRCWYGSAPETPADGPAANDIALNLTVEDAAICADFINLAEHAWGRDPEYKRLWGTMNLTLCMWLYRRMVVAPEPGSLVLTKTQFRAALTSLSANGKYITWILDRKMSERDRSPAYRYIRDIFKTRLLAEGVRRRALSSFPTPSWLTEK